MKRATIALAALLAAMSTAASAATWNPIVIRNGPSNNAPAINNLPGGITEFVIAETGQKAALSTSALDGYKVGDIASLFIDRVDDYTRFNVNTGPYYAPYMNFWITNGSGKFAVVANEPSNPEWAGQSEWNADWNTLKTKTLKVYENSDKSWLPNNGVGLTFNDVAGYLIQAPTVAELTNGWAGLGTGAPRELGTNVAYGFNWVFGDTLSNYVSGQPGYQVRNAQVSAIPEPAFFQMGALIGMSGLGLLKLRRRSA